MKELIGGALVFVVVSIALMVGGTMIAKTENVSADIVGNTTAYPLPGNLADDVEDALTTFTSLLPILALAMIGGLALFYLIGFLGRSV